jgi:hypothetical protein
MQGYSKSSRYARNILTLKLQLSRVAVHRAMVSTGSFGRQKRTEKNPKQRDQIGRKFANGGKVSETFLNMV